MRILRVAPAAVLALLLAGCGGSGPGGPAASNDGTPTTGAPTTTAGTAGSTSAGPSPTARVSPPEVNPAGDIPDNQVFIRYAAPSGLFTVRVPEGWARSGAGPAVTFTDKLNSIGLAETQTASAPTVASARGAEVPELGAAIPYFQLENVSAVRLPGGPAVLIAYRAASKPNPVTGTTVLDDVQRFEFWRGGTEVALTLTSPHGADNVDPWTLVSTSFRWTR